MKVTCEYCGRTNKEEREQCRSCGANLPDFETRDDLEPSFEPYFMDGGVAIRDDLATFAEWNI